MRDATSVQPELPLLSQLAASNEPEMYDCGRPKSMGHCFNCEMKSEDQRCA